MEYRRFERLIVGGTAALVLISLAASAATGPLGIAEVVGQLALVAVMFAAVHWGRRAGTFAALAACLLYLALRLPMLSAGLSPQAFLLILSRFAGYCLVGIVGGEIFARVKYLFAGSNGNNVIDDWSRVYNQAYAAKAITQAIGRHERYGEPFSLVTLTLDATLTGTQRPQKLRGLIRTVASFIRDDIRMVDDVARLDDGRFAVLLPHTPGSAAPIVADRLASGVAKTLGVKTDLVKAAAMGADGDAAALKAFAASLHSDDVDSESQSESGA